MKANNNVTIVHFVQRNEAVILLIHIQIFHNALPQTVGKRPHLLFELLSVLSREHTDAVLHDDVSAHNVTILH